MPRYFGNSAFEKLEQLQQELQELRRQVKESETRPPLPTSEEHLTDDQRRVLRLFDSSGLKDGTRDQLVKTMIAAQREVHLNGGRAPAGRPSSPVASRTGTEPDRMRVDESSHMPQQAVPPSLAPTRSKSGPVRKGADESSRTREQGIQHTRVRESRGESPLTDTIFDPGKRRSVIRLLARACLRRGLKDQAVEFMATVERNGYTYPKDAQALKKLSRKLLSPVRRRALYVVHHATDPDSLKRGFVEALAEEERAMLGESNGAGSAQQGSPVALHEGLEHLQAVSGERRQHQPEQLQHQSEQSEQPQQHQSEQSEQPQQYQSEQSEQPQQHQPDPSEQQRQEQQRQEQRQEQQQREVSSPGALQHLFKSSDPTSLTAADAVAIFKLPNIFRAKLRYLASEGVRDGLTERFLENLRVIKPDAVSRLEDLRRLRGVTTAAGATFRPLKLERHKSVVHALAKNGLERGLENTLMMALAAVESGTYSKIIKTIGMQKGTRSLHLPHIASEQGGGKGAGTALSTKHTPENPYSDVLKRVDLQRNPRSAPHTSADRGEEKEARADLPAEHMPKNPGTNHDRPHEIKLDLAPLLTEIRAGFKLLSQRAQDESSTTAARSQAERPPVRYEPAARAKEGTHGDAGISTAEVFSPPAPEATSRAAASPPTANPEAGRPVYRNVSAVVKRNEESMNRTEPESSDDVSPWSGDATRFHEEFTAPQTEATKPERNLITDSETPWYDIPSFTMAQRAYQGWDAPFIEGSDSDLGEPSVPKAGLVRQVALAPSPEAVYRPSKDDIGKSPLTNSESDSRNGGVEYTRGTVANHRDVAAAGLMNGTRKMLKCYSGEKIRVFGGEVRLDQKFEVLGTYSWAQREVATILVPGVPARLCDVQLPQQPAFSTPQYIFDENRWRSENDPFRPLFSALTHNSSPAPDFGPVDVLADASSLSRLLTFLIRPPLKMFLIDLELVGTTLVLRLRTRRERQHLPERKDVKVRRIDALTRTLTRTDREERDDESSRSGPGTNYRVVRYGLGGLRCVVRHVVDACLEEPGPCARTGIFSPARHTEPVEPYVEAPAGTPLALLSHDDAKAASADDAKASSADDAPSADQPGAPSRIDDTALVLPQYLARLPHVVLAAWHGDTLTNVQLGDLTERFPVWERQHQHALQRLVWLLHDLRARMARRADGRASLVYWPAKTKAAIAVGPALRLMDPEDASPAERPSGDVLRKFWGDRDTWDRETVEIREREGLEMLGGSPQELGLEQQGHDEGRTRGERELQSSEGKLVSPWTQGALQSRAFS